MAAAAHPHPAVLGHCLVASVAAAAHPKPAVLGHCLVACVVAAAAKPMHVVGHCFVACVVAAAAQLMPVVDLHFLVMCMLAGTVVLAGCSAMLATVAVLQPLQVPAGAVCGLAVLVGQPLAVCVAVPAVPHLLNAPLHGGSCSQFVPAAFVQAAALALLCFVGSAWAA